MVLQKQYVLSSISKAVSEGSQVQKCACIPNVQS